MGEREREIAPETICRSLTINLFTCPLIMPPFSLCPFVSSALSFRPLSLSLSFIASLGILFACGLVTAGRGESRARGESTLRRYSNFECMCPECKISYRRRRRGVARPRHLPCSRNEMSRHARLRFMDR